MDLQEVVSDSALYLSMFSLREQKTQYGLGKKCKDLKKNITMLAHYNNED